MDVKNKYGDGMYLSPVLGNAFLAYIVHIYPPRGACGCDTRKHTLEAELGRNLDFGGGGDDRIVDPGVSKDMTCQPHSILIPSAKDTNEGGRGGDIST